MVKATRMITNQAYIWTFQSKHLNILNRSDLCDRTTIVSLFLTNLIKKNFIFSKHIKYSKDWCLYWDHDVSLKSEGFFGFSNEISWFYLLDKGVDFRATLLNCEVEVLFKLLLPLLNKFFIFIAENLFRRKTLKT